MNIAIDERRIKALNDKNVQNGSYVLYWMQSSVRTKYNFALDYAKKMALLYDKPLVVCFGIDTNYPESNKRHLVFLLEGLKEVQSDLNDQNITTAFKHESPDSFVLKAGKSASAVVTDCGYLKLHKKWRINVAEGLKCPLIQVESDVVVPVYEASDKEEWSAATLRKKINQKLPLFLHEYNDCKAEIKQYNSGNLTEYNDISDIEKLLITSDVKNDVKPSKYYKGGYSNANSLLNDFITKKLDKYQEERNDPHKNIQSDMSPYLHFGQISPIEIALEIINSGFFNPDDYLEQLIVRRELAINFAVFNQNYDSYKGLPKWCTDTLNNHRFDKREYIYHINELESADTHDEYWNASQNEMKITGKMHGYMRMYWGKKIIEWSESPESAFETAVYLNNKYSLDGRDPNSYAGISWCFGKHDRAWKEREIFGKIRYMNAKGLERKFEIGKYVKRIHNLKS